MKTLRTHKKTTMNQIVSSVERRETSIERSIKREIAVGPLAGTSVRPSVTLSSKTEKNEFFRILNDFVT